MTWEQRLREMILAGGALAAAACADNSRDVGADASSDDATSDDASEFPNLFCCNANPDPCCSCDPDAAPSAECQAERTCAAEGGVVGSAFNPFRGCFPADAPSADASPADAGPDDDVVVLASCCNANPDPCCMCLDAAIDPPNCDQERVCEGQGGTWTGYLHSADGSVTVCAFQDGGPRDAGPDVDGHD